MLNPCCPQTEESPSPTDRPIWDEQNLTLPHAQEEMWGGKGTMGTSSQGYSKNSIILHSSRALLLFAHSFCFLFYLVPSHPYPLNNKSSMGMQMQLSI